MKHLSHLSAALAATALLLSACGGSSDDVSSAAFDDADVTFATDMVQHHAQALAMVDLTTDRTLDPEFAALADQIRAAQTPEIETMVDWLQDWDQPVPATVNDHANAEGDHSSMEGMEGAGDMPGMMSEADMTGLEQATDADFEGRWLELMVAHHEGAVEMARTEIADGKYPRAIDLARSIVASQGEEIDQMKAMIAG